MYICLLTIGIYFSVIIALGYFTRRIGLSFKDYIIANRSIHEIIAGISHVSAEISIGTFTVVASMIYTIGLSRLWIDLGFFVFGILSWQFLAKRLRAQTEANNAITIPQYLANRFGSDTIGIIASGIIIFFTTTYIGANMLGLIKVISRIIDIKPEVIGFSVFSTTTLYTIVGGFRSTCYTNVLQGTVMILAALLLPLSLFLQFGTEPLTEFFRKSGAGGPASINIGQALLYFSFASAIFGTPHTITKFLSIRSCGSISTARNTSIALNALIYCGIAVSAIYAIKLLPSSTDSEMLLFYLSKMFSNPLVESIIVLAMIAAVMSTIDAQLVLSASCMVNDVYRYFRPNQNDIHLISVARLANVIIGMLALLVSLIFSKSVGTLAIFSLTGLGSSIGPVILFSLYTKARSKFPVLLGLVSGATATILFTILNTSDIHYNMLPSLSITIVVILASYYMTVYKRKHNNPNNRTYTLDAL
ncbi:solute symporter family protein [Neorickettsia helminthoeca str. Oregon]|uniref:Solute symporter family protein n=1 Tax=Neorickettsia helminthoeca str. Oregon TaxID=1286528 RepID=X5HKN6_9RICK|nr:sodium:proline symporter [Neorickettsia helminthoeca]AHX11619.1 solute symporter family protein [Neorickettsia helminthoeca str. Oregon]